MRATRPQRKITIMKELKMLNQWIWCSKNSLSRYLSNLKDGWMEEAVVVSVGDLGVEGLQGLAKFRSSPLSSPVVEGLPSLLPDHR